MIAYSITWAGFIQFIPTNLDSNIFDYFSVGLGVGWRFMKFYNVLNEKGRDERGKQALVKKVFPNCISGWE